RTSTLFPYATLFRSGERNRAVRVRAAGRFARPGWLVHQTGRSAQANQRDESGAGPELRSGSRKSKTRLVRGVSHGRAAGAGVRRSEEHTSELQSREN